MNNALSLIATYKYYLGTPLILAYVSPARVSLDRHPYSGVARVASRQIMYSLVILMVMTQQKRNAVNA